MEKCKGATESGLDAGMIRNGGGDNASGFFFGFWWWWLLLFFPKEVRSKFRPYQ